MDAMSERRGYDVNSSFRALRQSVQGRLLWPSFNRLFHPISIRRSSRFARWCSARSSASSSARSRCMSDLRAGLTVAASIPISVLSISILRAFGRASILENNIVQTTGNAGQSIASGVIFTLPALVFLGFDLEYSRIFMLALIGGWLGVLFMIPLRRQLIVKEHGVASLPRRHRLRRRADRGREGRIAGQPRVPRTGARRAIHVLPERQSLSGVARFAGIRARLRTAARSEGRRRSMPMRHRSIWASATSSERGWRG